MLRSESFEVAFAAEVGSEIKLESCCIVAKLIPSVVLPTFMQGLHERGKWIVASLRAVR